MPATVPHSLVKPGTMATSSDQGFIIAKLQGWGKAYWPTTGISCFNAGVGAGLTCNGSEVPCLPNTLSVNFPGVTGGELLERVPQLCASTGAACHSGETTLSSTLAAIGLPPETARGTVRLSLGRATSQQDVEQAATWLLAAWQELR